MIFTQSLLKGFQVLIGWFPIDLAMAIAMLITVKDFPTREQVLAEVNPDFDEKVYDSMRVTYQL